MCVDARLGEWFHWQDAMRGRRGSRLHSSIIIAWYIVQGTPIPARSSAIHSPPPKNISVCRPSKIAFGAILELYKLT